MCIKILYILRRRQKGVFEDIKIKLIILCAHENVKRMRANLFVTEKNIK